MTIILSCSEKNVKNDSPPDPLNDGLSFAMRQKFYYTYSRDTYEMNCTQMVWRNYMSNSIKKIAIFAVIILITLCFALPAFAKDAVIQENNVNVRSGPGTDYEQIGQVNREESYPIIEEDDDWVEVQFENSTGWITKEYLTINEENGAENNEQQTDSTIETIVIQHDNTQLREGASTDYPIVAFTEKGKTFDVLSETEDWLEISDGDLTGFVLRQLVDVNAKENNSNVLKNKTIVIDPGHGGRDVGAIGINGSYEKDVTLLTARELENELKLLGANVILTRSTDEFVPIESRSILANAMQTDAFISIHYNSFPEVPSTSGIESFYYHDQDEKFVTFMHDEIMKETDERDRGVTFGDFLVIRQNMKPGALLELGFLSNEDSENLLQTTAYQKKIVSGIINGLQKYFRD